MSYGTCDWVACSGQTRRETEQMSDYTIVRSETGEVIGTLYNYRVEPSCHVCNRDTGKHHHMCPLRGHGE